MKRITIYLLSLLALMTSCGPVRYAVNVEMRYPSRAGVELAGKLLSVVYLENDDTAAVAFSGGMAESFARTLETDYGTDEGSVGVYRMRRADGADYAFKDSLLTLLVDTDADVVFLVDTVRMADSRPGSGVVPFTVTLYCFDGMDPSEKIYAYSGTSNVRVDKTAGMSEEGKIVGVQLASSFRSQWKHEQYSIFYFENEKWYRPLELAAEYDWKGAMELWFGLLSSQDMLKRSCAEYNIAVACYMLGDYELAGEWLDRSDADNKLPQSDALRKRINARS